MRIEPKKIMCAIDFSEFTDMVLTYGKSLAQEFDSKLFLCHVTSQTYMVSGHMPAYVDYTSIETEHIQQSKDRLEKMAETLAFDCEILVSAGHPADQIEKMAQDHKIDMVIAATHGGSGIKRFLIGSVTDRLMKILACPLLVLHSREHTSNLSVKEGIKLERILVGCDFSPDSKLAFDYALSLAQEFQTHLYLAHVIRSTEQIELTASDYMKLQEGDYIGWNRSEYLDLQKNISGDKLQKRNTLLTRLEKQLLNMVPEDSRNWCTPTTIFLEGQPYTELIKYAAHKEVDMIVLGVRGHSLLERFVVGSTTDRVISRASCPVLTVRQST